MRPEEAEILVIIDYIIATSSGSVIECGCDQCVRWYGRRLFKLARLLQE